MSSKRESASGAPAKQSVYGSQLWALKLKVTQFDFGPTQPTGVPGNAVELEAIRQSLGFCGTKGWIEGCWHMAIEIAQHHCRAFWVWMVDIGWLLHGMGRV